MYHLETLYPDFDPAQQHLELSGQVMQGPLGASALALKCLARPPSDARARCWKHQQREPSAQPRLESIMWVASACEMTATSMARAATKHHKNRISAYTWILCSS